MLTKDHFACYALIRKDLIMDTAATIRSFLYRMQWKSCTGELEGLREFKINSLKFSFDPAIEGQAQYDMFAFLLTLDASNDTRMALLLIIYLYQQKIPFSIGFSPAIRWNDLFQSLKENIHQLLCLRNIKKEIREHFDDVLSFPLNEYQCTKR